MFVITMLCSPERPALDPELVNAIRNAWGGGDVVWLALDEVAEFRVLNQPVNQWEVWSDCQKMGVDLIVQQTINRRKSMLIADMDSTLIHQECIDELAAEAGVGERVADITARTMNGELEFETALQERVALLAGLDTYVITKVLAERITYMPGGKTLVATMKANGAYAALVSGGFTVFTSEVADVLGFDEHRSNTLLVADGKLTGHVGDPILGRDAKVTALKEITQRLSINPNDVIAVGDGANDLGMLDMAGMGVALHAKPSVAAQCDIRINHGDLTALLYLQGYGRDEFVKTDSEPA